MPEEGMDETDTKEWVKKINKAMSQKQTASAEENFLGTVCFVEEAMCVPVQLMRDTDLSGI